MTAPLVSLRATFFLTCPRCRNAVPVNGLTTEVVCPHCRHSEALPPECWRAVFTGWLVAQALSTDDSTPRQHVIDGVSPMQGTLREVGPACVDCGERLGLDTVGPGGLSCACGAHQRVRQAGGLARMLVPQAVFVVGETLAGADDGTAGAAEPVLFACMGCGGSLSVDGSLRTVDCSWCRASNFLPDALWQRFHPVPTVRAFHLLLRLGADDRIRLRVADLLEARRLARARHLPEDVCARLAEHRCDVVRTRLARKPALPEAVQLRLASDRDADVRRALVANPCTTVTTLARLSRDSGCGIRQGVAERPEVTPEVLAVLLRDGDWEVRRAAARNPRTPLGPLVERVRCESDRDVLEAVAARDDVGPVLLDALADSSDRRTRLRAARHPLTPPEALARIADGRDADQLLAVADHPSATAATLAALVKRGGVWGVVARGHPTLVRHRAARWQVVRGRLFLAMAGGLLASLVATTLMWMLVVA